MSKEAAHAHTPQHILTKHLHCVDVRVAVVKVVDAGFRLRNNTHRRRQTDSQTNGRTANPAQRQRPAARCDDKGAASQRGAMALHTQRREHQARTGTSDSNAKTRHRHTAAATESTPLPHHCHVPPSHCPQHTHSGRKHRRVGVVFFHRGEFSRQSEVGPTLAHLER